MKTRGLQREMTGTVISDKMDKTVVVMTRKHVSHPLYRKVLVRRSKFAAHDEKEIAKIGDEVRIRQCRPISKTKRWSVIDVIRKSELGEEEVLRREKSRAKEIKKEEEGTES